MSDIKKKYRKISKYNFYHAVVSNNQKRETTPLSYVKINARCYLNNVLVDQLLPEQYLNMILFVIFF